MNADVADISDEAVIPAPRENPDLLGHQVAETKLLDAVESGRLAHAWLITGPKGIGKATLAFRFARYLLSHPPGEADQGPGLFGDDLPTDGSGEGLYLDPETPLFHRVASEGHGDLMTVELRLNDKGKMSTQIRVDDVRKAIDFAHMTSSEGGYKVIVVDGAELMNRSSENAFLKLLEEPPKNMVILMVSHAPGRLLPTTRSRCRTLALKPLEHDVLSRLMNRYLPELSSEDVSELARLSDGSIGRALTLSAGNALEIYHDLVNIIGSLPRLNGEAVQKLAASLSRAGNDDAYNSAIELYRWWLSRIVLAASRGAESDPTLTDQEKAIAARAAETAILPIWLTRLDETESLIRSADALNLDRKQVLLSLFLSLV